MTMPYAPVGSRPSGFHAAATKPAAAPRSAMPAMGQKDAGWWLSMAEDPICANDEARAMAAYHPGARPRRIEWLPDENGRFFLGGSSLVKTSAAAYRRFIDGRKLEEDETQGFWAKQGNRAAEAHFSEFTDYQEIQVRVPLHTCPTCGGEATGDDVAVEDGRKVEYLLCANWHRWLATDLVGHIDAILVYDEAGNDISREPPGSWPPHIFLVVAEHKLQDSGREDEASGNIDLARRQAILYLSWLQKMLATGVRYFRLSDDETQKRADGLSNSRPLAIPDRCEVVATRISVRHWPRNSPPARVKTEVVDDATVAQIFDRYRRKAIAVMGSQETAAEWGKGIDGLREFKQTLDAQAAGIEPRLLLRTVLEYELGKRRAEQWENYKKNRSAEAVAMLKAVGEKTVSLADPGGTEVVWAIPTAANTNGDGQTLRPNLRILVSDDELEALISELGGEVGDK